MIVVFRSETYIMSITNRNETTKALPIRERLCRFTLSIYNEVRNRECKCNRYLVSTITLFAKLAFRSGNLHK
ncbi:hypothetical protein DFP93_12413 [Aneurinibacillus soli]|uniref:Uncharacterized protein n=1 Tax=Aneurinibacillus soli TaxID=1500254 RepID=A0A0U5AVJ1_9BACL|nr:hypothetical protein DFP93_12413 [Aneurinibacillus soli]BAU26210.1 hypothetical protein CB4_00315 [Aneurinibacillus soli]